jgi:putative ubiquitin-RnfH superfamily antitoxin RatB of RatAB toxin-antitoxin module
VQNNFIVEKMIAIEVAYAEGDKQLIVSLDVARGVCVAEAIKLSEIIVHFPTLTLSKLQVGIFGKVCELDRVLKAGDRIELYRPLICDPKQARRNRAKNSV